MLVTLRLRKDTAGCLKISAMRCGVEARRSEFSLQGDGSCPKQRKLSWNSKHLPLTGLQKEMGAALKAAPILL